MIHKKPIWDDGIDIDDIIPPSSRDDGHSSAAKKRKKANALAYSGTRWDEVEWDGTEDMRNRVLDEYMEGLYELEFNDMVAGMPTHFRYVPVAKTPYGPSASEILLADDKDLNEYVGLKKLVPYRKQRGK